MFKFLILFFLLFLNINISLAGTPRLPNLGLPGDTLGNVDKAAVVEKFIPYTIALLIQYVAIIAVISLMIAGIYYLIYGGVEDKRKKAKNWLIWSIIGVFLSISAWGIINLINGIQIK